MPFIPIKKSGQNHKFVLELLALSLFLPHEAIKKETGKFAREGNENRMISFCCLAQQRSVTSFSVRFFLGSFFVWLCAGLSVHIMTINPRHLQACQLFRKSGQTSTDKQTASALAEMKTAISNKDIAHFPIPATKPVADITLYPVALPVSDNRIVFVSIMHSISQRTPPVALL